MGKKRQRGIVRRSRNTKCRLRLRKQISTACECRSTKGLLNEKRGRAMNANKQLTETVNIAQRKEMVTRLHFLEYPRQQALLSRKYKILSVIEREIVQLMKELNNA